MTLIAPVCLHKTAYFVCLKLGINYSWSSTGTQIFLCKSTKLFWPESLTRKCSLTGYSLMDPEAPRDTDHSWRPYIESIVACRLKGERDALTVTQKTGTSDVCAFSKVSSKEGTVCW